MSDKKKAVFMDLDGTLWSHEVVPASAWAAIRKARANGHLVFVNTGRTYNGIPDFLWNENLDGYCMSAGGQLYANRNLCLKSYTIPRQKLEKLMEAFGEYECGISLATPSSEFCDGIYLERHRQMENMLGWKHKDTFRPLSDMSDSDWQQVVKIHYSGEITFDVEGVAKACGFDILPYTNQYNPSGAAGTGQVGEMYDDAHTKATAMESILEAMGLNAARYDIVAIGDSENDVPMFEAADLSICMGNGTEPARKAAMIMTDRIDQDGLYKAFDRLGMLETPVHHPRARAAVEQASAEA